MRAALLALALSLAPTLAPADAKASAADMLTKCKQWEYYTDSGLSIAPDAVLNVGLCLGFFSAWNGVARMFGGSPQSALGVCRPPNVTNGQMARIFVKYAQNHPEQLHEGEGIVALYAISEAFPCPR